MAKVNNFPNYLQIPKLLPKGAWHFLRAISVLCALAMAFFLFARPAWALPLFWLIIVPALPVTFMVIPGLWRNLCPLAAMNQAPRLIGFTSALPHTPRVREYSYVVGIGLFFLLVSSRKWLFDQNGAASGALILFGLIGALMGGLVFKGKSGWCSSICPLLPVQRIYGQTPLKLVGNSHCQPCVGCTKNCYDFNPKVAFLADQYDDDRYHVGYRRFFAAALPGFILGFFTVSGAASPLAPAVQVDLGATYGHILLYTGAGMAIYQLLDTFAKVPVNRLNVIYGAAAFNIYYWFAAVGVFKVVSLFTDPYGAMPTAAPYFIRIPLWLVTGVWLWRGFVTEDLFRREFIIKKASQTAGVGQGAVAALKSAEKESSAQLVIEPDQRHIAARPDQSLLELIESCGARIESGCRMGVCGADPIAINEGMDNLTPADEDECNTLARLGHADNTRMACKARIKQGQVTIALVPQKRTAATKASTQKFDAAITHVIVIGNGIAGVTAADHVRRRHPSCRISLIAEESHHLYNRMAITRLVYGRSAMQGLYLMPETWYSDRNIDVMLNTKVRHINVEQRLVAIADGETLSYDRLIFATGSNSFVPPLPGYGTAGCYVLRTANDAMDVREYAQSSHATHAVIAGGGLLGLEAAYALHKLGLQVTIVERNKWLLNRQLDERGALLLESYLTNLGLHILSSSNLKGISKNEDGKQIVQLEGGQERRADIFIVAAGIAPNTSLAVASGLKVKRGIVVDARMRTSAPNIFAAGDVAEIDEKVMGLWPVAVEQAEIAACNALGESRSYQEPILSTQLKVVGADLISVGKYVADAEDTVFLEEDLRTHRYRKLVARDGVLLGAILIGWPELIEPVSKAVKSKRSIKGAETQLQSGDWSFFKAPTSI